MLALLWGLSWPLMKLALAEMPPLRFRAFSVGVGGLGLLAVAFLGGAPLRISRQAFWRIVGISLFSTIGWSIFMSYGLRLMASSRAAIIAYTFPVWSVPLSAWLLGESLTRRRLVGLVLGMAGLVLLLGDEIHAVGRAPLGALLMFATATSWAFGMIIAKKWPPPAAVTTFTAWMNVVAFVPLLLISLAVEEGPFTPFGLHTGPMIGVLYSALVAALLCQWAWFKLVAITPATLASMSVLAVPIVGVFCSMLVLRETPRFTDYAALILVVGSLSVVMLNPREKTAG